MKRFIIFIVILFLVITNVFTYIEIVKLQKQQKPTATVNQVVFLNGIEQRNVSGINLINISSSEAEKYENVVRQFETYQINHNVSGRLNMFLPPSTDQEKSDLAFLIGTDTKPPFPRLDSINVLTYKLNWYSFNSVEKKTNGNFLINVLECKTYYSAMQDPMTNPDLYFTYQRHYVYEITRNEKIVEYYASSKPQSGNTSMKYNGFQN